jgi:S1-C subfamily serine protease
MSKAELQEAQRLSSNWKIGQSIVREGRATAAVSAKTTANAPEKQGTGTVFIVDKSGHAITNQHVIGGCTELRIEGREGTAKVITDDKVNDLALLQIPGEIKAAATIAKEPQRVRQGEDIVVFGFPLNVVLSSGGNLTPGVVSALTGLGNNTSQIQITAPIQPGSSGSPVLNKKGEVVGVVSMKLSDKEMARSTGSVGQNVAFAVSGQTLKSFLDAHQVDYRTSGMLSFERSSADLADEARKWTSVVECWR